MFWRQEPPTRISCCSFVFFPFSTRSCQEANVPVHGRAGAGPHLTSPPSIWAPSPTARQLCQDTAPGGTGRGKCPHLQRAAQEWRHCPLLSCLFQAGVCWWTGSTTGDGSMLEVPTSFLLCPLCYWIPPPLVAAVNLIRALVLALGSFISIFSLTCLLLEPTTSHFLQVSQWLKVSRSSESLERYFHYCSNWYLCPSGHWFCLCQLFNQLFFNLVITGSVIQYRYSTLQHPCYMVCKFLICSQLYLQ